MKRAMFVLSCLLLLPVASGEAAGLTAEKRKRLVPKFERSCREHTSKDWPGVFPTIIRRFCTCKAREMAERIDSDVWERALRDQGPVDSELLRAVRGASAVCERRLFEEAGR